ncbi:ABC transporter ATP-binding protein [Yinghuangia soli]|uniref:ABC transporter ATP-binding protein n=1 Tax=Yinghuangia soli TaxID=2908204 RepID=A0AA41PYW9_9ACTN|nr:ABC transporter ATP-binding protein [Yinghuangia soli]MCF2527900.1 ABC transporter ATP-binding protein [Yinghuangia soli]
MTEPQPPARPGASPDAPAPEVELRGIVKRFPGVLACDRVDLAVAAGEVHALMGENGAGKSTLMSVLYGLQRPDAGQILLRGTPHSFTSPLQAIDAGLGMVHQGFKLFPSLSVTENVVYGSEPVRRGLVDRAAARAKVAELVERHGLQVPPDAKVGSLPVGVQQRVEILKLLYRDARVLILDEPTAVLTPAEADRLLEVVRGLAAAGRTVLLVTHKLHEVMAVSDNVTVLRDGRVTARLATAATGPAEIAAAMTGRDVDLDRSHPAGTPGNEVLTVQGLTVPAGSGGAKPLVDAVSLEVRAGEIVGIAGVAGNGQSELVEALAGLRHASAGRVVVAGTEVASGGKGASVAKRRAAGLAYVPEDRAEVGAARTAPLADNLAMGFHRSAPIAGRGGLLRRSALRAHAARVIERFGVKAASGAVPIGTLSGGNQQKAILGREITHDAPLLIVEQPTRGVDIGSIENIHARLVEYRDAGHGILLVSAELSEVLALSDRVLVMYEGRVVAELPRAEADAQTVGLAMAGGTATGGTAADPAAKAKAL